MIAAIACIDFNYGIGYQNDLLVKIPDDMKRFKQLTNNSIVIMGRKTWDSLPNKPLPNRFNIVITHDANKLALHNMNSTMFVSMERAKEILVNKDYPSSYSNADVFVIGGESIYSELLPFCEDIYLTMVYHSFENVDAKFPRIGYGWDKKEYSDLSEFEGMKYRFVHYVRRKHKNVDDVTKATNVINDINVINDVDSIEKIAIENYITEADISLDVSDVVIDTIINIEEQKQFDDVERPKHYTDGNIEVIDFIEDKKLGFCLGNVVKYVARAGKKKDAKLSDEEKELEDLKKALWYLKRRIFEVENKVCLT